MASPGIVVIGYVFGVSRSIADAVALFHSAIALAVIFLGWNLICKNAYSIEFRSGAPGRQENKLCAGDSMISVILKSLCRQVVADDDVPAQFPDERLLDPGCLVPHYRGLDQSGYPAGQSTPAATKTEAFAGVCRRGS